MLPDYLSGSNARNFRPFKIKGLGMPKFGQGGISKIGEGVQITDSPLKEVNSA